MSGFLPWERKWIDKFLEDGYIDSFRFHNKSEIFDNLYFVGAGTHPGAGMPGVLSSAKVLDELL